MAIVINKKSVLALGFFDSIHKGHRYLINKGKQIAHKYGLELTILTFNDDFLINLNRYAKEVYLLSERVDILSNLGIGKIIVLNPTKDFLMQSEKEFMNYLLSLNPAAIVAGNDYKFGYGGKGNINILNEYMTRQNVEVVQVDLQTFNEQKISSSNIKALLDEGNIEQANTLLQQKYFVSGKVIKGRGVGKKLGVPTANITVNNLKQLPKEGIYKTSTEVNGTIYESITNIGVHPTFNDDNFNIETLLLNFNGNLYRKEIKIFFEKRVRDIIKFNTPKELVLQIKNDIFNSYGKDYDITGRINIEN